MESEITNENLYALLKTIINQNNEIKQEITQIKSDLKEHIKRIDFNTEKIARIEANTAQLQSKLTEVEQKLRKNNLVIFGLDESIEDVEQSVTQLLLDKLDITLYPHDINNIYRLGKQVENKSRPVLLQLTSYLRKQQILKNVRLFKGTGIGISNDLTVEEREQQNILQYHLKAAKQNNCQAKIFKNKLIINGKEYSSQDLVNNGIEHILEVNSEAGSSQNVCLSASATAESARIALRSQTGATRKNQGPVKKGGNPVVGKAPGEVAAYTARQKKGNLESDIESERDLRSRRN